MKKIILSALLFAASFGANAQATIFEDSFELYTPFAIENVGNWTLTDVDGLRTQFYGFLLDNQPTNFEYPYRGQPKSFQVYDPALTVPSQITFGLPATSFTAKTGSKSMVSFGCMSWNSADPADSNNWLISPKISLGITNVVKFWAKAASEFDYLERFNVYVSNTTTAVSSFVKINTGNYIVMTGPGKVWNEYTFTIPATYDNTPVHIAIQCVSPKVQGSLLVDDFKVTGTIACPAPSVGTAVAADFGTAATLSWTSASTSNAYEVKLQLAGAGFPLAANNTGIAVSGATTYTANSLIANTNYEFWVREECTDGVLFSAWSGPFLFNTNIDAPNCVTLVAPTNAATSVQGTTAIVALSWTPASTGTTPTSYDVYFGATASSLTLLRNVTILSTDAPSLNASTTYFWKVIAKNSIGDAVGCTSVFSFTTATNPFLPYCGPLFYGFPTSGRYEPITSVQFAGISKTYPNTTGLGGSIATHKIFTDVATVAQGSTYPIALKGITVGFAPSNLHYFTVFIDWNQNGLLSDAGEVYFGNSATAISISNSTGLDAISALGNIVVPATATLGNTRMRIRKQVQNIGSIACNNTQGFGENQDYIINVIPPLATNTFNNATFASFPNPVKDVLNLTYDKNITNISVINLLGQEVLSLKINSNNAKIDMSTLKSGIYMVKVFAENQEKTIKVIKE